MSFIDTLFAPKKKTTTTDGEKLENYMLSRFQLIKDPDRPFTYWLPSGKHTIEFNPEDVESVMRAEEQLLSYYKAPVIREASREEIMLKQGSTKKGKTGKPGEWQKELKPIGDIARNAQEMSANPLGGSPFSPRAKKSDVPDLGDNPLGVGRPPSTEDVMNHIVGGGESIGGDETTDYLLGGANLSPGKKPRPTRKK
jgi:hypothetical protein